MKKPHANEEATCNCDMQVQITTNKIENSAGGFHQPRWTLNWHIRIPICRTLMYGIPLVEFRHGRKPAHFRHTTSHEDTQQVWNYDCNDSLRFFYKQRTNPVISRRGHGSRSYGDPRQQGQSARYRRQKRHGRHCC